MNTGIKEGRGGVGKWQDKRKVKATGTRRYECMSQGLLLYSQGRVRGLCVEGREKAEINDRNEECYGEGKGVGEQEKGEGNCEGILKDEPEFPCLQCR